MSDAYEEGDYHKLDFQIVWTKDGNSGTVDHVELEEVRFESKEIPEYYPKDNDAYAEQYYEFRAIRDHLAKLEDFPSLLFQIPEEETAENEQQSLADIAEH